MSSKVYATTSHLCRSSADRMYDAWLDEATVRVWYRAALLDAGMAGDVRAVEIDARSGGRFVLADQRGDTEARHWGRYEALERPLRIVFTWVVDEGQEADPSRVTLTFEPRAEGCLAAISHEMDAEWERYTPQTAAAWLRMLRAADEACAGRA